MSVRKISIVCGICISVLVTLIIMRHNFQRRTQLVSESVPSGQHVKYIDFLSAPDGKSIAVRRRIEQPGMDKVIYELWLLSLAEDRKPNIRQPHLIYTADAKNFLLSRFLSWDAKSEAVLFYTWDRKTKIRTVWEFSASSFRKQKVFEFKSGTFLTALRASDGDVYAQFDDEIWNISSSTEERGELPRIKGDVTYELIGIVDDSIAYMIAFSESPAKGHRFRIFNMRNATVLYSDEIHGNPVYLPAKKEWVFVRKLDKKTGWTEIVSINQQHLSENAQSASKASSVVNIILPRDLDSVPVISNDGGKIAGTYLSGGELALYHQTIAGTVRKTMTPSSSKFIKDSKLQWLTNSDIVLVTSDSNSQIGSATKPEQNLNIYSSIEGTITTLSIP